MVQKYFSQKTIAIVLGILLFLFPSPTLIYHDQSAMAANLKKVKATEPDIELQKITDTQSQDVIVKSINPILGKLVYTTFVLGKSSLPLTIHTYTIGKNQKSMVPSVISNTAYRIEPKSNDTTSIVYNPQISPDGKYVLFQYGQGYEMSTYTMFILDLTNHHLIQLKPQPRYTEVHWSPDSNFIAYIMGGTQNGDPDGDNGYYGPLVLHALNWRTGEDYTVVSSDVLAHSFSWIAPHNLVYGTMTNDAFYQGLSKPSPKDTPKRDKDKKTSYPNIYEYNTQSHHSELLFKSGYRPVVSPNGKKLAFYGLESSSDSISLFGHIDALPSGSSLIMSNIDGSGKKAMNLARAYSDLMWEHDNQHLLSLQQLSKKTVQIVEWDTITGHFKKFTFDAEHDNTKQFPHFRLCGLSADGRTAFVAGKEFVDDARTSEYVKAINLSSGKVYTVISIEAVGKGEGHGLGIAMDWRYGDSE